MDVIKIERRKCNVTNKSIFRITIEFQSKLHTLNFFFGGCRIWISNCSRSGIIFRVKYSKIKMRTSYHHHHGHFYIFVTTLRVIRQVHCYVQWCRNLHRRQKSYSTMRLMDYIHLPRRIIILFGTFSIVRFNFNLIIYTVVRFFPPNCVSLRQLLSSLSLSLSDLIKSPNFVPVEFVVHVDGE